MTIWIERGRRSVPISRFIDGEMAERMIRSDISVTCPLANPVVPSMVRPQDLEAPHIVVLLPFAVSRSRRDYGESRNSRNALIAATS
jgi:hypothetical protein